MALLSTGLFKSCTVGCSAAPVNTPPVFVPKTGGAAPAASAGASFRLGEGTLSGAAQVGSWLIYHKNTQKCHEASATEHFLTLVTLRDGNMETAKRLIK